jgi:hypothetical protein
MMPRAEINEFAKNISLSGVDELLRMMQAGARNGHSNKGKWIVWGSTKTTMTTTKMEPIIVNGNIPLLIIFGLAGIGLCCLYQACCRLTRNLFKCPNAAEQSLI